MYHESTLICCKEIYLLSSEVTNSQLSYSEPKRSNKIRGRGRNPTLVNYVCIFFFHRRRCSKHIVRSLMTISTKNKEIRKSKFYTVEFLLLFCDSYSLLQKMPGKKKNKKHGTPHNYGKKLSLYFNIHQSSLHSVQMVHLLSYLETSHDVKDQ